MANQTDQSGIIRTRKDRSNPYTMLNKAIFEDNSLSWEARGVLAYLLSKPDDWQVRTADLLNQAPKCGADKLARILKELETAGYLVRERRAAARGRFEWITTVYENPLDAGEVQAKTGKRRRKTEPQPEKQDMAPYAENPVMVPPHQEAKSTITGFTINGSAINGKPAHILSTDLTNESRERVGSARKRATPPPTLDFAHEAVTTYKRLSGRKPAPAQAQQIAGAVTDIALWERAIDAWLAAGFNPGNIGGMLDWYREPARMERKAPPSRAAAEPRRPVIPSAPTSIAPDAHSPEETARRARAAMERKRGQS